MFQGQANSRTFSEAARYSSTQPSSQLENMEPANASAEALRKQIATAEAELKKLRAQLAQVEADAVIQKTEGLSLNEHPVTKKWPLLPEEYKRYGRQMIVPSIGIQGTLV